MDTYKIGKAFVFGDNLDTDQIYPGQYLELANPENIKLHAMEGADPEFVHAFQVGDIIIGGRNFGCGSSREHAAIALKEVGVGVILAESFARIFYRNAINLGIPLLVVPDIRDRIGPSERVEIDLKTGQVTSRTTGVVLTAQPLSEYVLMILENGGIKPLVKRQLESMGD